ncbi:MAG: hypothetical protein Q8L74_13065 [Nitrospirota bacterium]|nr:hypothetical protein [Nitrospirota bacterium]
MEENACEGCGRINSDGVHYADCTRLQGGEWTVLRESAGTEKDAKPFATQYMGPPRTWPENLQQAWKDGELWVN